MKMGYVTDGPDYFLKRKEKNANRKRGDIDLLKKVIANVEP